MTASSNAHLTGNANQFSLGDLFEYVSLCAVLAAFAPKLGVVPMGLLMGLSLALAARQGFVALVMLMGASLTSDLGAGATSSDWAVRREFSVLAIGVALVAWYGFRHGARRKRSCG